MQNGSPSLLQSNTNALLYSSYIHSKDVVIFLLIASIEVSEIIINCSCLWYSVSSQGKGLNNYTIILKQQEAMTCSIVLTSYIMIMTLFVLLLLAHYIHNFTYRGSYIWASDNIIWLVLAWFICVVLSEQ